MASIVLSFGKGLGDHLQLSAIVRDFAERYGTVEIFCLEEYLESIAFLYRDLPNVRIIKANTQSERGKVSGEMLALEPKEEFGILAERAYYAIAGMPIERRWSGFKLVRDFAREKLCTQALAPSGPYQFIDDGDGRFNIDRSKLNPALPEVWARPSQGFMFFDYMDLIAGADEVHVVESAFMFLADHVQYEAHSQKLFAHRYARPLRPFTLPLVKKSWHIL